MKKCPFCAEEIQDEAIKCKHCGEWLNREASDFEITEKRRDQEPVQAEDRINSEYGKEIISQYQQMSIDEFSNFLDSYNPDDYTPEASSIIRNIIEQRRKELSDYRKVPLNENIVTERKKRTEAIKPQRSSKKPFVIIVFLVIIVGAAIYLTLYLSDYDSEKIPVVGTPSTDISANLPPDPTSLQEPASPLGTLYIAYNAVNVRSGPSTLKEIIGQLKKYETIRGLEVDGWVKFRDGAQYAYISASVLKRANSPLHVKINKFSVGAYGYFTVVGEVINTGKESLQFVELEAIFYDANRNVVGTEMTYACSTDYLLPGRMKPFEFMGENQPDYKSVSVRVKDYEKVY